MTPLQGVVSQEGLPAVCCCLTHNSILNKPAYISKQPSSLHCFVKQMHPLFPAGTRLILQNVTVLQTVQSCFPVGSIPAVASEDGKLRAFLLDPDITAIQIMRDMKLDGEDWQVGILWPSLPEDISCCMWCLPTAAVVASAQRIFLCAYPPSRSAWLVVVKVGTKQQECAVMCSQGRKGRSSSGSVDQAVNPHKTQLLPSVHKHMQSE